MNEGQEIRKVPRFQMLKNALQFVRNPIPVFLEFAQEYGPTYAMDFAGGNRRAILSIDPDFIQAVLVNHHRRYRKSDIQTNVLARYIGKGLLTSEGDYWKRQRRLIQPGFHKSRLDDLLGIMTSVLDTHLPEIDQAARTSKPLDMVPYSMDLAFRIITRALFSTSTSDDEIAYLEENIATIQRFIVRQVRQPYLGWWFRLSGQARRHLKLTHESHAVIMKRIKQRRASEEIFGDLLAMLFEARYEDTGEGMDDQTILDEVLILAVAGHETSANALAWTFYLLSKHPDIVKKLHRELDEVFAEKDRLTFDALQRLEYTRCVIQESMRLYPPAWALDRVAEQDDEISGITIRKGTMIIPFLYGLHHAKAHWQKPERFRPERFTKEESVDRHPYAYLPFGSGPRQCIGNNVAMMEMQLVVARIMKDYDVEANHPAENVELLPLVTLRPKGSVWVKFRRRA